MKNRRNLTGIIVGLISFGILFFGISLTYDSNEISISDLPEVSTTKQATEAVTTVTSEITTVTSEITEEITEETTIASTEEVTSEASSAQDSETVYILNTSTKKFHYPDCRHVSSIKDENKSEYTGSRDDLIEEGYSPCGTCNP